ncbi:MAG: hypothetical protein EAZ12_00445 [Sphingobacteriia bacterium]|nr:MAG: hypothetical protein EAZ12_00445 [Sphingobacteriia bacterium]
MENSYRERSNKGFNNFRRVYDITMAILFLSMAIAMFYMDRFKLNLVIAEDIGFRYFFGSICLLYGGFRLYRGIKKQEKI